MTFKDRYKIAGDFYSSMALNENGETIIDERVEITADTFAIGEMLEELTNKLEQLRIRGL